VSRRLLLPFALLFITFALAVFVSGGFVTSAAGVRMSARSPAPAAIAGVLALIAWAIAARRAGAVSTDLASVDRWISTRAMPIVIVVAALSSALSIRDGTFSASGSDASGYLSEAEMLWNGELSRREPLAAIADWFDGPATLAPLGWRAAADGTQVPTYAVGLPLAMAPFEAAGGVIAASLIVPLSLGIAVWAAGVLASRAAGPAAAILAAVWLASVPISLYESMQPMSDVPVTAAWLVCWLLVFSPPAGASGRGAPRSLARVGLAGLAATAAVLIRPNLAPLAALPALFVLFARRDLAFMRRVYGVVLFAVPVAMAGILVGYLQWRWFGSAFRSGYGTAREIYSAANVAPNVALYTRWLIETHGPWLLAAPLAAFLPAIERRARIELRWMLGFAALLTCAYLLYSVFEVWTYLRFLLPAMAVATVAVSCMVAIALSRAGSTRGLLVALIAIAICGANLRASRQLDVFRLADRHARASLLGAYLALVTPPNAVIVSGEQSGALRYDTGRSILRWDLATPGALAQAIGRLREHHYDVWFALDEFEEELLRRKLSATPGGALDWPPAAEAGSELRTRAWRLRDRDAFMRGEAVHSDRLR